MKVVLKQEKCYICGRITDFTIHQGAVLFREARCIFCGSSIRNSDVAEAVLSHFMDDADTVGSITSALPYLAGFRILNTCSSGPIHECLKYLPGYIASEFFDDTQNGHYKQGVLCAD